MRMAAYGRVSTDSDEQLESLENQKIFFEDFANKNNYKLVKIYADEGISGKQMKNRTQFLTMLEDAKLNLFDIVIVKDISRFARNTVDFLNAIRQLKTQNIEVQFLSNNQTILGNS
jgi:DNA invertase Pin-like site-specific DNA recombinase